MNKSIVLQDYNGNNIYPIIPYQNVFGLPSVSGKQKIFFGDGKPSSYKSNYKDIEVNDIYINTNAQNRQGYFYVVNSIPQGLDIVAWSRVYGFYIIQNIDAPSSMSLYYTLDVPSIRPGIIWLNMTNNKIFVCMGTEAATILWKELTDFYTKSEVDALFDELRFKINKKAKKIKDTAKGSTISLTDSAESPLDAISIMGKSTQTKTNGYQLIEKIIAGVTETSRGITFEYKSEGKVHISGTLTGTTNLDLWLTPNNPIGQGQYYAKGKGFTNDVTFTFVRSGMAEQTGDFSQALNLTTDTTYPVRMQIKAGVTNLDLEVQVMIERGTTSHDYESYTGGQPSPSIDYPQTITDITQEEIEITNGTDTQTATLTKTLRGIPVSSGGNYTDNNNQQWICDTIERYKDGSGKYIQRINRAEIDGSNTNYKVSSNQAVGEEYQRLFINNKGLPSISNPSSTYPQMSDRYQLSSNWIGEFEHAYAGVGSAMYIFDKTERLGTTVQTANDYLSTNPTSLLYILATPIETPLTSDEIAELDLDTYYPSTTIGANADVVVEYVCDTKNYIDKRMAELQNAIISQGGNV